MSDTNQKQENEIKKISFQMYLSIKNIEEKLNDEQKISFKKDLDNLKKQEEQILKIHNIKFTQKEKESIIQYQPLFK